MKPASGPASQGRIHVDLSRRPLIVATFVGVPNEAQFVEYLEILATNLRTTLAQSKKTAMILDTTQAPVAAPPRLRQIQAEWLKEHHQGLRLGLVGMGFVIQSALVRGAMTAVMWLQNLPYPYSVCATLDQAERFCAGQLAQHNYVIPPRGQG